MHFDARMRLSRFLTELFQQGHVRLDDAATEDAEEDLRSASEILAERARVVAADFPNPVPDCDLETAAWAAGHFFSACRFVLLRDAPIDEVRAQLCGAAPPGDPAVQHFSVDLVWRFLPDLDRLTTTLAPQDPLREIFRQWGGEWPFSSVGMKGIELRPSPELLSHAGLCRAYIDRIVACRDTSRLRDPQIRDLVHAAIGRERATSSSWCNETMIARESRPTQILIISDRKSRVRSARTCPAPEWNHPQRFEIGLRRQRRSD